MSNGAERLKKLLESLEEEGELERMMDPEQTKKLKDQIAELSELQMFVYKATMEATMALAVDLKDKGLTRTMSIAACNAVACLLRAVGQHKHFEDCIKDNTVMVNLQDGILRDLGYLPEPN